MACVTLGGAIQASDGKGKLEIANFVLRCVKLCFVQTPLARVPFLLIQVFTFVVKQMKNIHFWTNRGTQREATKALGSTGVERKLTFSNLDRQASSERLHLEIWIDRRRANAYF